MRQYSNKITLARNSRGIYTIDPIIGCEPGMLKNKKGCFGDCYAARNARIFGYDFSKSILRDFENEKHLNLIINKANRIEFGFIRMGNSGDPSINWDHTIKIIDSLKNVNKPIVIITKHWEKLTLSQLKLISKYNVTINTSISSIDENLHEKIEQYEILKKYCNSVLRVVSFKFNCKNTEGLNYSLLQNWIFNNYEVLDTVFRCSKSNNLYKTGIINVAESKFLGDKCNVSMYNDNAYFGDCLNCIEKCGINM